MRVSIKNYLKSMNKYPDPKKSNDLAKKFNRGNISEWPNTYVIYHDIRMMKAVINDLH